MSTETLRDLATAVTDLGLGGPWGWFGDTDHTAPFLGTEHGGRKVVLGTATRYQVSTLADGQDPDVDPCDAVYDRREVDSYEAEGRRLGQGLSVQAQLTFPHRADGDRWSTLKRADELPVFEVAPQATSADDPAVYRTQVRGVRNPVATYLAAVDPSTVLTLLDRIADLEAQVREADNALAHAATS